MTTGGRRDDDATTGDRPADAGADAPATPPPATGWRRWRKTILAFVVAAVVLGGVVAMLLFGGEKPRDVSTGDALDRYRSGSVPATEVPTTLAASGFHVPAAGVYQYRGSGTEDTSFPPLQEQQGPDMPATVTHEPGECWSLRIDYNTHHWQDWTWCASDAGVVNTLGHSFARRDFVSFQVDNLATFTCTPPVEWLWAGMQPGEHRDGSCTGTSTVVAGETTSAGRITYVGDEDITVGDQTVRARHLRYERTLSGGQVGPENQDFWVEPDTGLPYRNERSLTVETDTPFGRITYTEQAEFQLQSLTPAS